MAPDKCRRCKCTIPEGVHCEECKQIIFQENIEKQTNRALSKLRNSLSYGVGRVKEVADGRFWATAHDSCFRCSATETPAHYNKKFERWMHHRKAGRIVFCELILKNNMGKPDLVVVDKGFIFIEEIVCTEKEASIYAKKGKYPFPINTIKV